MNKKQIVPVEVQIRTEAMDLRAQLGHELQKTPSKPDSGGGVKGELMVWWRLAV